MSLTWKLYAMGWGAMALAAAHHDGFTGFAGTAGMGFILAALCRVLAEGPRR